MWGLFPLTTLTLSMGAELGSHIWWPGRRGFPSVWTGQQADPWSDFSVGITLHLCCISSHT